MTRFPERESESDEEARTLDEEVVREIMPQIGFPVWPPEKGAVPDESNYFENEDSVMPTRPHFPNTVFLTLDGPPSVGKTSLGNAAKEILMESETVERYGIKVHFQGELLVSSPLYYVNQYLVSHLGEDDLPPVVQKGSWIDGLYLQLYKELYYQQLILNFMQDEQPDSPTIFILERGPVDALFWQLAIAAHEGDPSVEIPDDYRDILNDIAFNIAGLFSLSTKVNASIQVGMKQSEAQQRRDTRLVKSPFYNDLSRWNGHYVNAIFPNMHDTYGTGLLTVNGNKPIEDNAPRIAQYIEEAAMRLLPRPQARSDS